MATVSDVLVEMIKSAAPTIAALTALVYAFKAKQSADKGVELANTNTNKIESHNEKMLQSIAEVKQSVDGQVERMTEEVERRATAETLLTLRKKELLDEEAD